MSEQANEQISAMVDEEIDPGARSFVLRRMAEEQDCCARWGRYHLISEALKNNLPRQIDPAFSERLRAAIETVPVPVTTMEDNVRPLRRFSRWMRPAAGIGIAASVAAMVLLGFQDGPSGPPDESTVAEAAGPTGTVTVVRSGSPEDVMKRRFDRYVTLHNGLLIDNPMRGYVPYVRLVDHRSEP